MEAPGGPPASTADFLARLDPGWLAAGLRGQPGRGPGRLLRSAARQVADVALRFRTLLRRLGAGLDGPGGFGDADAWYCILEGTAEISRGRGAGPGAGRPAGLRTRPARAGRGREILLAVDEFSAVSRRLPIWQLYERARSLGLAVQVSAQSWQGLAADEDERYRVAAPRTAASGCCARRIRSRSPRWPAPAGWWTPRGGCSACRCGRIEGLSRAEGTPVVDPELIRGLDVGQAAYIYRGGVTYVQVKRLVAAPAAAGRARRARPRPAAAPRRRRA